MKQNSGLTIREAVSKIILAVTSGRGGTGRRARLRGVWETIRVQVPSAAPEETLSILEVFFMSIYAIIGGKYYFTEVTLWRIIM